MGEIKKKDLAYNYQYAGGEVTVYEMTGQDLKDYMEWSAAYFNQARGGDVTVSFNEERRNSKYSTHDIFGGISYEFDLTKPEGERVTNLTWPEGEAENGRTNIESVNITDPVRDDLIAEIAEKTGVDSAELEGLETTGELYQKVNELRK